MTITRPDWDFKERDVVILEELAKDPQLSARELTDVLQTEHDIDVSHVTVSKSIRNMRDAGVFRETIIPHESYFTFALFQYKLNPSNFKDNYRDALEYIRTNEHTLFFCLVDGEYQWMSIMMFPGHQAESRWVHEFYKKHGHVIHNLRNRTMINVLDFGTDPGVFNSLRETDGEKR